MSLSLEDLSLEDFLVGSHYGPYFVDTQGRVFTVLWFSPSGADVVVDMRQVTETEC